MALCFEEISEQLSKLYDFAITGPQVPHRTSKVESKKLPRQKAGRKRRISEPGSGDTFVIDLDTGSEPGRSAEPQLLSQPSGGLY